MPPNEVLNATGIMATIEGIGINPIYLVIGIVIAVIIWQKYKKPKKIEKKKVDDAIEDIDEKIVEKKSYIDIASIPQQYRYWGGILSAGIIFYGMSREWAIQKIGIYLLGVWILIYIMGVGTGDAKKTRVLTWQECKIKLYDALRQSQLQPFGEVYSIDPESVIRIGMKNNLQTRDGKPYSRFMDYFLIKGRDITHWLARMEPFTGQIQQTSELLFGWRGDEQMAEEWIKSREWEEELRRQKHEKKP